jgi:hypothetical protein
MSIVSLSGHWKKWGGDGRVGGRLHPEAFNHEKMSSHTNSLNFELHLDIGKSNEALHENSGESFHKERSRNR